MKTLSRLLTACLPLTLSFFYSCGQGTGNTKNGTPVVATVTTVTENKQFNGYSINVPKGWAMSQGGDCTNLSFISWDPARPERQFFYYGIGGIFYLSEQQKNIDNNYVNMGGMRTPLIGQPVISPVSPENYLKNFYRLLHQQNLFPILQKIPELYNVQIVSATVQPAAIQANGAVAALIRAVFTDRNKTKVSEGLFLVTTMPFIVHYNYGPGANFGIAYSFMGITAPLNELETVLPPLEKCMAAFNVEDGYAQTCIRKSNDVRDGILQAGRTLSQSSSTIMQTWENRNRSQDISSQRFSDGIMGRERLFDPQTKTVYTIDNMFLEKYRSEPGKYNYSNLQKLPADDYNLWRQAPLQGSEHIRRIN